MEYLLNNIESITDDSGLSEKITKNRAIIISKLLSYDNSFLNSLNQRAALKSGRTINVRETTKWQRDELAKEVSKQLSNYSCQGCQRDTFIDKRGNNFVESHHIIEYNSKEEGPDVLQNLLVLCPNCHSKIHFERIDIVNEFYKNLRSNGVINLSQFIEIHNNLRLLFQFNFCAKNSGCKPADFLSTTLSLTLAQVVFFSFLFNR